MSNMPSPTNEGEYEMIRVAIVIAVLAAAISQAHAGETRSGHSATSANNTPPSSSVAQAIGTSTATAEGSYYSGQTKAYALALPSTALTSSGDCIGSVTLPLIGGGSTYRFDDCKISKRIGMYRDAAKNDPGNADVYAKAELTALCKLEDVASELPICPAKPVVKTAKSGRE